MMEASIHVLIAFLELLLVVVTPVQAFPVGVIGTDDSSQIEKEAKVIADPNSTASDMIYVSNQGYVGEQWWVG